MVVIIDYGVGNLTSIQNMVRRCGVAVCISSDPIVIEQASKLILPGVGSFDHGISNLRNASYFELLKSKVTEEHTPILGVCLGAQLLTDSSEEGVSPGLGWIKGKVVRFDKELVPDRDLKIPHMGWSEVSVKKDSVLLHNMHPDPRFYFVHSYHIQCDDPTDELLDANYGYTFTAGFERHNILGVQFHPEKSHKYGLRLYENFVNNF